MTKNPIIIGMTGNIATGKSTVLAYLATKGVHVVDADKLGHQVMEPGKPAYDAVVTAFGEEILAEDGTIYRPALGKIVFADPTALQQLEAIIHPAVFQAAQAEITRAEANVIVMEAIKLLESGRLVPLCDEIWVVTSTRAAQLQRLRETRNMAADEAERRMAAQSSQTEKIARADRIIDNSGSLEDLHAKLDQIWLDLREKYPNRNVHLPNVCS